MRRTRPRTCPTPTTPPRTASDDATVDALGKLSEALETVERARGQLYTFHQLTGEADIALQGAVDALREAGHAGVADRIERELVGRNVLQGRWTFQVVEDYDDGYWSLFRALERTPATSWRAAGGTSSRPGSSRPGGRTASPGTRPTPPGPNGRGGCSGTVARCGRPRVASGPPADGGVTG